MHDLKQKGGDFCCKKHTKYMKTNETDEQLLALMTHVQAFLKGRLTLGELAEAEERAEIFRTNQVINYDEVAERVNAAQLEQENAELRKDKERLDWLIDNTSISIFRKDEDGAGWWVDLDDSEPRGDIDAAMEESQ